MTSCFRRPYCMFFVVVGLVLLWALVLAAAHRRKQRARDVLPLAAYRQTPRWDITVDGIHLRVQTTALNTFHDKLSRGLAPSVLAVYDVGIICALLGMLVAFSLLIYATVDSVRALLPAPTLTKRALEPPPLIRPIIPGVTVPFSHIIVIFLAVLLGQVVHELGHAVAAALSQIPLYAAGLAFLILPPLPSAFVSLPASSLNALPPIARARIIAAGPFHNLLFLLALFLAGKATTSLHSFAVLPLFFDDLSGLGRVVVSVHESSALYDYLPPGSLITRLDDTPLASDSKSLADPWSTYLRQRSVGFNLGWCIDGSELQAYPNSCCRSHSPLPSTNAPPPTPMSHLACFDTLPGLSNNNETSSTSNGCIDPVPILTGKTIKGVKVHYRRCSPSPSSHDKHDPSTTSTCKADESCVIPRPSENLLRIVVARLDVQTSGERNSKVNGERVADDTAAKDAAAVTTIYAETVLLWSGPREEIDEQVTVSRYAPGLIARVLTPPLPLRTFFGLFLEYTQMATLSLYLFNLLPLPFLDGAQFLRVLLDVDTRDLILILWWPLRYCSSYSCVPLAYAPLALRRMRRRVGRWLRNACYRLSDGDGGVYAGVDLERQEGSSPLSSPSPSPSPLPLLPPLSPSSSPPPSLLPMHMHTHRQRLNGNAPTTLKPLSAYRPGSDTDSVLGSGSGMSSGSGSRLGFGAGAGAGAEPGTGGAPAAARRKDALARGVRGITVGCVGLCVVAGLVRGVLGR
ncbi:hypothetical protein HGRIS_014220 [Hohenbuehelia grisea]|uniref:Endopeptidase S2P n=1 Tax=Hohenbuehelia grisea TaxID=104357 RepID=A0ABR3JSZ2_9AGAR